jgi:uncharacterized RDD family membrane protein YckC
MPDVNAYQIPADPTAVIGRRIGAWLIDLVLYLAIAFLAAAVFSDFKSEEVPDAFEGDACDVIQDQFTSSTCFEVGGTVFYDEGGSSAVVWLVPLAATVLNHVVLAGTKGGSLGKLAVGLRVVKSTTGQIAGIGANFLRTLLWIVDGIPFCFPLVGLITGLTTKGHRRVGDMAASTLVVGKDAVGRPPFVPGLTAAAAAPGGFPPPAAPGGWAPPSSPQGWDAPPPPTPTWGAPTPPAAPPPPDPWSASPPPPAPAPAPAPAPEAASETSDPWSPSTWAAPDPVEPVAETPAAPPEPTAVFAAEPAPAPEPADEPAPAPEPEPEPQPAPAPEPAPAAAAASEQPGVGAPMWDAARNAYIQWDPAVGSWMQWDDNSGQWRPIS